MATKNLLVDGAYYTAFAKRKKIRGMIYDNGCGDFRLLNNQGVGDSYADFYDDCDFSHGLHIERDINWDEKSHNWVEKSDEQALKTCGVTQFQIVTDRRVKAVINADILPKVAGFKVIKLSNGSFSFGCGALVLTPKEVEKFVTDFKRVKKLEKEMEKIKQSASWEKVKKEYENQYGEDSLLEELDISEGEELLNH